MVFEDPMEDLDQSFKNDIIANFLKDLQPSCEGL